MVRTSQHGSARPKSLTIDEAISKLLDASNLVRKRGEFKATEAKRVICAFDHLRGDDTASQGNVRLQNYVKFLRRVEEIAGAAMVTLGAAALGQAAVYTMTDRVRTELPFSILERKSDLQHDVLQALTSQYSSVGSTKLLHGQLVNIGGQTSKHATGQDSQSAQVDIIHQPADTSQHESTVTQIVPADTGKEGTGMYMLKILLTHNQT
ncbi:hypothetical protein N7513_004801 [Penicillium frequentans]|uniref:Uncharacterized protein n=1 Tax=Penicillium frequentans TaxID=3151616 RepID=A0AAD6CQX9_9EURO|nr:hypothetical protein N7494_009964 [Penicillium glabrum]KAJ5547567.1 hypothetical protein N7513_004801 [Penicillium glabrum]